MKSKKISAAFAGKHSQNQGNNNITKETRQESYVVRPVTRSSIILNQLEINGQMTAREIAYELGYSDLNAVKPRLTELKELGKVEVVGKRYDWLTKRNVAVWKKCEPVEVFNE